MTRSQANDAGLADHPLVAGRACGTCTLCCKLYPVPELGKPAGQWCRHVVQAKGCGIHKTRPNLCRAFHCQWLYNGELGPEWKPETCKFVLSIYQGSSSLAVTVDPGAPRAWTKQPYYRTLKTWASAALAEGQQVVVFVGNEATVIFPDHDAWLGRLQPGDEIVVGKSNGPAGPVYHAHLRDRRHR